MDSEGQADHSVRAGGPTLVQAPTRLPSGATAQTTGQVLLHLFIA